jgi:hypothetical protein
MKYLQYVILLIQNVLLLIVSTAVGVMLGFLALAAVVASMQKPTTEPWLNGMGQLHGGLICGAPLGAIAGLVVGVALMRGEVWSGWVWLGILLGLVCAPFAYLRLNDSFDWYQMALILAACGMAGGLIGGVASVIRRELR